MQLQLGFLLFALSCLRQGLVATTDESCSVSILEGSPVYVEYGGSLVLNCTFSCENITYWDWETSLTKKVNRDGSWVSTILSNITVWESSPICFGIQNERNLQNQTTIIAYRPPTDVSIRLAEVMEVNQSYPINCSILSVAPLRNTRVTFRRGEETLHVLTFENSSTIEGIEKEVTYLHTAQETDYEKLFSCLVELDLTPQGKLFNESSSKMTVKTFALPEDPEISMATYTEEASEVTVKCWVSGVFPAEEVNLSLELNGEDLNVTVTRMADVVTAEVQVTPMQSQEYYITCNAILESKTRSATKAVYVYSFPDPLLTVIDASTKTGNNVTINCSLAETKPTSVSINVTAGGVPLSCEKDSHFQTLCVLTVQREDHAKEVVCEVQLKVSEWVTAKRTSAQLDVTYTPIFSDSSCPSAQTLVEGSSDRIRCQAEGNPTPHIRCTRDDSSYIDGRGSLTRAHLGTYVCTATNSEGLANRNVTVTVEYKPTISSIDIDPPAAITKGKIVTLQCFASGLPLPKYQWSTPKVENITYSSDNTRITIYNAQTHHSGSYTCTATNIHGSHMQEKSISVTDPVHTILAAVLGTAAGCGLVAAAIGYYLYYRAQKIRKYKLQQAQNSPTGKSLMANGGNNAVV